MTPEIISAIGSLVILVVGYFLGQYAERRKQSLIVRSDMLKPIEEWVHAVEKFNGILGDTFASTVSGSPIPVMYDLKERQSISKFMVEKSNVVFGILQSEALKIRGTKKHVTDLVVVVRQLDSILKTVLLPLDNEIHDRARTNNLTPEFAVQIHQVTVGFGGLVQTAYLLISKIKTSLT